LAQALLNRFLADCGADLMNLSVFSIFALCLGQFDGDGAAFYGYDDPINDFQLIVTGPSNSTEDQTLIDLSDLAAELPTLSLVSTAIGRHQPGTYGPVGRPMQTDEGGNVIESPLDDFTKEVMELMGIHILPDVPVVDAEPHPCEPEREKNCPKDTNWINCLSQVTDQSEYSDFCKQRLQDSLPYMCQEAFNTTCKSNKKFSCLKDNFATLNDDCIDGLTVAMKHIQNFRRSATIDLMHLPTEDTHQVLGPEDGVPTDDHMKKLKEFRKVVTNFNSYKKGYSTFTYVTIGMIVVVLGFMTRIRVAEGGASIFEGMSKVFQHPMFGFEKRGTRFARYTEVYGATLDVDI